MSETPVSSSPARSPRTGLAVGAGIAALMLLAVGALLISSLGGSGSAAPAQTPASAAEATRLPVQPVSITILHTNDTWGYLIPCG
jgi:2',3'-cyclic-nucleotide 2'-phosphodiesterase (5'-nucleotidase family)